MNAEQEYQGYGITIQDYVFYCEDGILQIYDEDKKKIKALIKLDAMAAKCFAKYFTIIAEALEETTC